MPASPLPEADVSKIVAYIRSLRATAIDTPVQGDVAHGSQIFNGKGGCKECHMVNGRGGLIGPDLSNIAGERSVAYHPRVTHQTEAAYPAGLSARTPDFDGRSEVARCSEERAQLLSSSAGHEWKVAPSVSERSPRYPI